MKRQKEKFSPRILITAGPTRAYLDRVRYLTNYSTGELGFEICRKLKQRGGKVSAVVGPTRFDFSSLKLGALHNVETSQQMLKRSLELARKTKPAYAIFSAAVLDFEPANQQKGKRRSSAEWHLKLRPTPKIIDRVQQVCPGLKVIGFKLEWEKTSKANMRTFAESLIESKGLEVVCLNYLSQIKQGSHPALLMSSSGDYEFLETKREIASWIVNYIAKDAARPS